MSNVWKEPIFDRTLADVTFATKKIADWKKYHTHSVGARVENQSLIVRADGTTYVTDSTLVLDGDVAVTVVDGVLVFNVDDVYDLKGCLNLSDLNRIEGNIAYLAELMESYSYSPNIHYKHWVMTDMPNQSDVSRIIENIRSLIGAYYSPDNPPSLPSTMLSYTDINAIEENLYLIKQLLECMQSSFEKAGAMRSGSRTFLPIRR